MVEQVMYSVEFFLGPEVTTFDFGNWGMAIFHNGHNDHIVVVYSPSNYRKYFVKEVYALIDDEFLHNIKIERRVVRKIKSLAKDSLHSEECRCRLLAILEESFDMSFDF